MLKKVLLSGDVFSFCAAHAFITEKEEIMGLLIGEKVDERVYKVSSALALKRSDKRPDRVEISPEQLSQATSHVENLSEKLQRHLSIVGWYHSHPHITAMPSDVDIRTQASYQLLDQCFIGLIFSVFNTSKTNQVNKMQVCCFQSCVIDEGIYERIDVNMEVVPSQSMSASVVQSINSLPGIFFQEESELYDSFCKPSTQPSLSFLFNKSIFTKNMVQIMQSIHIPLISFIENKIESNKSRVKSIKEEKEKLKKELENVKSDLSTISDVILSQSTPSMIDENSNKNIQCDTDSKLSTPSLPSTSSSLNRIHHPKTQAPHKFYEETSI